jgi:hypothetical protein
MRPVALLLSSHLSKSLLSLSLLSLLFLTFWTSQAQADDLNFYQNFFVTGGTLTNGVGLATAPGGQGTINMTGANGVPCRSGGNPPYFFPVPCTTANAVPADIVAAYMYWEVVENPTVAASPAATIGYLDGSAFRGIALGTDSTSKCWSNAANQVLRVYRADIRRFLPIQQYGNTDPTKSVGVRVVNGSHKVIIGNDSKGNKLAGVLTPLGASMVVVYRVYVPGAPLIVPLVAVTIYDGVHTIQNSSPNFTLDAGGFYQATGSGATMTNIVGGGNSQTTAPFFVNNNNLGPHIFSAAAGASWDNPTLAIPLRPNDSSYLISAQATNAHTCLSWGAVVSTIPVVDTDKDGLLDVWESRGIHLNTTASPATFGGCSDYPAEPCLNLPKMGAVNGVKDLFIHLDWMHQTTPGPFGSGGIDNYGTHDHMPKSAALQLVCQTFKANGVAAHFDVGTNYQGLDPSYCIVPAAYAWGGHDDNESAYICPTGPLPPSEMGCTYNETYAVLGWKGGLQTVRDGHSASQPLHFQHFEKDAVHYLLMAHALAGPYCPPSPNNVNPLSTPPNQPCTPGVRLTTDPTSVSGIADRPGGDLMITFGLWGNSNGPDDKVGTVLQQAGTILHEVGHNLGLFHGGVTRENCMPNYFSSMSYLFQTRGLDDSSGTPHIGYSYGLELPLSESFLSPLIPMGILQYKPRFYAPLNLNGTNGAKKNTPDQASQAHCDGTPITNGAQMVLLENSTVGTPDWSNGTVKEPYFNFQSDINFNGVPGETFFDVNDWFSLNFQQISPRPNFFGLSTDSGITDAGITDAGITDAGITDAGITDAGITDAGITDAGITDAGITDAGITDAGITDAGITDAGINGGGGFDIDAATLIKTGSVDPSPTLTVTQDSSDLAVSLTAPSVVAPGATVQYVAYRCNSTAAPCDPTGNYLLTFSAASTHSGGSCTFTPNTPCFADMVNDTSPYHSGATCPADNLHTCYNTKYTYLVVTDETLPANTPTAVSTSLPNTGEVVHLFVIANTPVVAGYAAGHLTYGVLPIPVPASTTYGDLVNGGTVAGVTCAYYPSGTPGTLPLPNTSVTPRNAGTYSILCTGPATGSGGTNVGVSYNVTYLTNVPGTLTIDARQIMVTAASAKVYDGNTTCPVGPIPACSQGPVLTWAGTGPALAYTDTPNFTESFDNKNVGTTHKVTPAGTVNDGGSPVGNNYTYNYVPIYTGAITPATLTITASTNTKTYDGTTSAAAIPTTSVVCDGVTVTGGPALCGTDTVTGLTETYDDPNAGTPPGTPKSLSVGAGYTVNDGNLGKNYTVVTAKNTTGQINQAPVTATAGGYTGTYDGNPHPTTACVVTGTAPATFTGTVTCTNNPATAGPNASPNPTAVIPVPAVAPTDTLNNYLITPANGSWKIAPAPVTATAGGYAGTFDGNSHSTTACAVTPIAPNAYIGTLTCTNNPASVGPNASPTSTLVTPVPAVGPSDLIGNYAITSVNGSWSIAQAPVTATAGGYSGTFDGNTHTLSACGVSGNYTGTLSCTNNPAAPVGPGASPTATSVVPVPAVVGPDLLSNYAITYVNGSWSIALASSTTTVTCPAGPYTYNGAAQTPCSVTVTGAGGLSLTPTPSYSNNTNAGPATASYTYVPDANHSGSNNSAGFTILQAPVTATAGSLSGIYNGSPQSPSACMVTATAPATFTGGLACTNNPSSVGAGVGSGVVTPVVTNANFLITPANGAWSIGQAASSVNVTCPSSVTYTGSPLTPCSATVTGAGGLNLTGLTPTYSNNTSPGTATASYTYAGDTNHTGNTGSSNFTINPAANIDFTTLSLVGYPGSPAIVSTATPTQLSMTSGAGQTAAAWLPAPQPVGNSFTSQFQFQISPNNDSPIADGFAFVIQNSMNGTGALGTTGAGGYLGYQGLTNSVAIEFDTYPDCWDPNGNHVAIQSNWMGANNAYHNTSCMSDPTMVPTTSVVNPLASPLPNLSDGAVHSVTVTYIGGLNPTLTVVLDGTQVLSTAFSMSSLGLGTGGDAVVGFTAATGSYSELTYISNWTFTSN